MQARTGLPGCWEYPSELFSDSLYQAPTSVPRMDLANQPEGKQMSSVFSRYFEKSFAIKKKIHRNGTRPV